MFRLSRVPKVAAQGSALAPLQRVLRTSTRAFATDADSGASASGTADGIGGSRRKPKPLPDPFKSTQKLTRLVRLPTMNGEFSVVNPFHTRVRLRDRKYLGWIAHRYEDDLVTRKWSKKTQERRARSDEPWTLSKDQLLYLRLYGNPYLPKSMRTKDPRTVIEDVEKSYIQKLLDATHQKSGEDGDPKNAPKTPTPKVGSATSHIPNFKAGDKIRITKYISMQKEKFEEITGIVLARYGGMGALKKQGGLGRLNASFVIRNRVLGEGFEMQFPLYSPFIKKIEILEAGNYRKNKLFYLRDKDPTEYMV